MLSREVNPEPFVGNLKLARGVTVSEESECHDEVEDGLLRQLRESRNVHCLRVVAKPVLLEKKRKKSADVTVGKDGR